MSGDHVQMSGLGGRPLDPLVVFGTAFFNRRYSKRNHFLLGFRMSGLRFFCARDIEKKMAAPMLKHFRSQLPFLSPGMIWNSRRTVSGSKYRNTQY